MAQPTKYQDRVAQTPFGLTPSARSPDFNFMEKFPPMGKVTPAYMAKLGVRDNHDYNVDNAYSAYNEAHSQDEEQRGGDSDLGPRRSPSLREQYGF